jgi:pyruvate dehydrogenase E2 component (dihydrolipoamide acetyltransferase)
MTDPSPSSAPIIATASATASATSATKAAAVPVVVVQAAATSAAPAAGAAAVGGGVGAGEGGAMNGEYEDIPLTNMRKVIASRLTTAKGTVPHHYTKVRVYVNRMFGGVNRLFRTAKGTVPRTAWDQRREESNLHCQR